MDLHWDILDRRRLALLPAFSNWKKDGFYLAGGTALALQIGHRTSVDFDFYREKNFEPLQQARKIAVPEKKISITTQKEGTLLALVNTIQVSAFHYPYPLLRPLIKTPFLALASLEDIAAMKLVAIAQRGKKRDFVDMFFLCRKFSLPDILEFTRKKYSSFDIYTGLRGLVFFDEAEREKPRMGIRYRASVDWNQIKQFFRKAVHALLP